MSNLPVPAQQTYDNNSSIRTAVNRLTELLEWLYPEPSPDIFTVRDYRNRYPFTRLGPLATSDIDRYQRINRAIGNHEQLGLCDYHIGLIYLHEGEFRAAVQQFEQARQQWAFVNQSAAIALTHLARAVALRRANHYESALVSAGKVRVRMGVGYNRAIGPLRAKLPIIRLPLLVMHGEADPTTPKSGSELLYNQASSPDKTLKLYAGLYHEIHNEPEKETVLADITAWLDAHC